MNTKTTKFLAVLAVLAFAFAAFAVTSVPSEVQVSDAASQTSEVLTTLESDTAIGDASGDYYVKGDITGITWTPATANQTLNLFLDKDSSIVFGVSETAAVQHELNIYLITSYDEETQKAKYDDADKFFESSAEAKNYNGLKVERDADGFVTFTTAGNVGPSDKLVTMKITTKQYYMSVSDMPGKEIVLTDANDNVVLPASAAISGNFTIESTLNGYDFQMKYTKPTLTAYAHTITVNEGNVATFEVEGANAALSKGSIDLIYGSIKTTNGFKLTVSANAPCPIEAFTTVAVALADTTYTVAAATVLYATLDDIPLNAACYVSGYYEIQKSVTLASGNNAFAINIPAYQTLVIPEGKTLTLDCSENNAQIVNNANGVLDVWGKIVGKKGTGTATLTLTDGTTYLRNGANIYTGTTVTETNNAKDWPAVVDPQPIAGTLYQDYSLENQYLSGPLTIDEGVTVTVKNMLALNGQSLIVKGTLVIDEDAVIGTTSTAATAAVDSIVLTKTGTIVNNGTIGKNYSAAYAVGDSVLTFAGLAGMVPVYYEDKSGAHLGVSGEIEKISGVAYQLSPNEMVLTMEKVFITDDLTVPAGVWLNVTSATVLDATLKIDGGRLDCSAGTVTLAKSGAVVDLTNGYFCGTGANGIKAPGYQKVTTISSTANTLVNNLANVDEYKFTSGYTLTYWVTEEVEDDTTYYYQELGISGTSASYSYDGAKFKYDKYTTNPTALAFDGYLNIFPEDTFAFTEKNVLISITENKGILIVEGTLTSPISKATYDGYLAAATVPLSEKKTILPVGAYFDDGLTTHTYYITSLNAAIDAAKDNAKITDISVYGVDALEMELDSAEISGTLTITEVAQGSGNDQNPQIVIPAGEIVKLKSSVIFGDMFKSIDGILYVYEGANCAPAAGYDVKVEAVEYDMYCGLLVALELADRPSEITYVGAEKTLDTLTVPSEITLIIGAGKTLNVTGAVTVEEDAVLEVLGTLNTGVAGKSVGGLDVQGEIKALTGTVKVIGKDAKNKATIAATGELKYKDANLDYASNATLSGAVYAETGAVNVLTTLATASESGKAVTLYQDLKDAGIYEMSANLTVKTGYTVEVLSLSMAKGKILTIENKAKFTGILSCDVSSSSTSVGLDSFVGTITAGKTMNITAVSAAKTIMLISGALEISAAEAEFDDLRSAKDTTVTVSSDTSATIKTLTIYGDLTITGAKLDITKEDVDSVYIAGDITLGAASKLNIGSAARATNSIRGFQILGNVTGGDADNSVITTYWNGIIGDVSGDDEAEKITFSTVKLVVNKTEGNHAMVVLGSNAIDGVAVADANQYYKIDLEFNDEIVAEAISANVANGFVDMLMDLQDDLGILTIDVFLDGTAAKANPDNWYNGKTQLSGNWTPVVNTTYTFVYDADSVTATVDLAYNQTQISVYIGGIFVAHGTELKLEPGIYALNIQLAPGYSGITYATLDGEKVYDSFVVTEDMCDGQTHQLIGILVPETDYSDDVGISIEYTLDETALVSIYAFDGLSVPAGDIEITVYYWMMLPTGTWYLAEDITVEAEVEGEAVVYATEVSLYEAAAVDIAYLQVAYLSEDEEVAAISARIVAE